ncbi:hypothetical protein MMC08_005110 [Hypocenomyce scalaris]|nr:hypothetical protein [Hypocenomyce scalaris]
MNKIAGPEDPHFDPEQTLFHPFLPRCGSPLALRRLELNYVDLRWSADTVAPALNFSTLKALKIHCCTRTDLFLSALSQPTSRTPPQLEVLHVKYVEWSHPDPVVDAIDDYLANSQDSLIKLWICLRGSTANPKVSGILRHGSTLKQLFIDVRDTEMPAQDDTERAITYSIEQWRLLARGLVNVVQLAVPFNKIYADGRPLFAHGVPELVFEIELAILLRLPRLETLNITTHPYPNHINTTETTLTAHTQLTTLLANQILALSLSGEHSPRHEPSRLEVIAFGIREGGSRRPTARPTVLHGDDPEHKLTPTYFAKAQHVLQGMFTNEAPKAVMVKVPFRTLKLNNLAVDLMEEVLEDTLWDEVSEAV